MGFCFCIEKDKKTATEVNSRCFEITLQFHKEMTNKMYGVNQQKWWNREISLMWESTQHTHKHNIHGLL